MSIDKPLLTVLLTVLWSAVATAEPAIPAINAGMAGPGSAQDAAQLTAAAALVARAREKCQFQPEQAQAACVAAAEVTLRNAASYVDEETSGVAP